MLISIRNPKPGESGEFEIPAYQVKNSSDTILANRVLQIIMSEFFTLKYARVIPEMAHTVGVSKSQISRATIEAGQGEIFLGGSVHRDETQNPMNSKNGPKTTELDMFCKVL
jgi:hypothetical protein